MGRKPSMQTLRVLRALLEGGALEEHYGLELSKAAGIPSGTIYPMLSRLERQGWVTSRWEDTETAFAEGRPRKRLYQLTGEGARAARENLSSARQWLVLDLPHHELPATRIATGGAL